MLTACWVTLWTRLGNARGTFLLNGSYSLHASITSLLNLPAYGQRNNFIFSKSPREHTVVPLPLPFVLVILANSWKMEVLDERQVEVFKKKVVVAVINGGCGR